jgi:hypothetical protein
MLTGMFRDKDSTEGAYRSLRERGYTDDEINVMMSDETRDKYFSTGDTELEGNKASKELVRVLRSAERSELSSAESLPSARMSSSRVLAWSFGDRSQPASPEQVRADLLVDWSVH